MHCCHITWKHADHARKQTNTASRKCATTASSCPTQTCWASVTTPPQGIAFLVSTNNHTSTMHTMHTTPEHQITSHQSCKNHIPGCMHFPLQMRCKRPQNDRSQHNSPDSCLPPYPLTLLSHTTLLLLIHPTPTRSLFLNPHTQRNNTWCPLVSGT